MNALNLSKGAAGVRHVAIDAVELRVIPDVEDVAAELHIPAFSETRLFNETHVPVVDAWSATDGTRRIADGSGRHGRIGEESWIKHEAVILANILGVERRVQVRFAGEFEQVGRV